MKTIGGWSDLLARYRSKVAPFVSLLSEVAASPAATLALDARGGVGYSPNTAVYGECGLTETLMAMLSAHSRFSKSLTLGLLSRLARQIRGHTQSCTRFLEAAGLRCLSRILDVYPICPDIRLAVCSVLKQVTNRVSPAWLGADAKAELLKLLMSARSTFAYDGGDKVLACVDEALQLMNKVRPVLYNHLILCQLMCLPCSGHLRIPTLLNSVNTSRRLLAQHHSQQTSIVKLSFSFWPL